MGFVNLSTDQSVLCYMPSNEEHVIDNSRTEMHSFLAMKIYFVNIANAENMLNLLRQSVYAYVWTNPITSSHSRISLELI